MNILCVDDEPIVLEQLEHILQPVFPFLNFFFANDSSQAISISKENHFHLAIVDIEMPGKSGLELVRDLKENQENLPVVILSAHQDFHLAKTSIHLGVAEYLTKPIFEDELKETVSRFTSEIYKQGYSKLINETLSVIEVFYEQRLSLQEVASKVHVSPAYLSRRFSEEVGTSLTDYINQYRLEKAKLLLLTTDETISAIAERTGFNSLHYFSTQFKKKENMTPKEFRERNRRM
ncbi:MAG TPA: helix-turn-helix domain-containing protein [Bacillus sp. (in: firmicutes)]|uniref:helix-turn-helix domain-containing protein n=1 Tax=Bacillus litorisediminis TaxID=2922713 RepID=UPI001FAF1E81|nr:helix-turn-helix domain-containing protein [Bacillus litorisediminis]HWO74681.1 helix-turn-helix domain-containing protein [Bacillus sp. (in: firmicutes)]